jgi:phosphohistidine swiveling domain-containing protein
MNCRDRRLIVHLSVMLAAIVAAPSWRVPAAQSAGPTYAIRNARIVTMAGAPLDAGTIVMRDGLISDVGAAVTAPPDAIVTDGTGLTVYPGFIDMANGTAAEVPDVPVVTAVGAARGAAGAARGQNQQTLEELERVKRATYLRPDVEAARYVRFEGPEMRRLASAGITSVLAVPTSGLIRGQSALINVMAPPDGPQIGNIGDYRRGLVVVKSPVAQHISFTSGGARGAGYPIALLGTIAFVRQSLYDAQWQREARAYYEKQPNRPRPVLEPALDALLPVLDRRLPAAFEADRVVEIARALDLAKEFGLDPIIVGGAESGLAAPVVKAAGARVIYSLNFPTPPTGRGRGGAAAGAAAEDEEPIRDIRARQNAPKGPAALAGAGVAFAFSSDGLEDLVLFRKNAARTVTEGGLTSDAALAALTSAAARLAGVANQLGTLEKGRIANMVVTDGDWLQDDTRIRHVFIDGRPVDIDIVPPPAPAGRGRRGGRAMEPAPAPAATLPPV